MPPLGWALLGTGIATGIAGAVTGGLALSKANALEESCPEKVGCSTQDRRLKEESDVLATTTNVLLPVGGALAVAGGVLAILGLRAKKLERAATIRVNPHGNAEGAVLVVAGRF